MPRTSHSKPASDSLVDRIILPAIAIVLTMAAASSAQPVMISYQGRLTNGTGGIMPDSTYSVEFALFDVPVGGAALWTETADISTNQGQFNHSLGSVVELTRTLLLDSDSLFLQVSLEGIALAPRSRILSAPYAAVSGDLRSVDSVGVISVMTDPMHRSLTLYDSAGTATIVLRGNIVGDSALQIPEGSVNANEIADEPGIAVDQSSVLMTLPTSEMIDLAVVTITIPEDGYIVLHGKCYAILSGTTGPNRARVQIDETEGGAAIFPYYTIAGLGGYVNTSESYFPMYVTRAYFKPAGTYEFRLEGKADQNPPALARTWDHILTAVYYPTQYENVKATVLDPNGFPGATPLPTNDSLRGYVSPPVYEVDLKKKADSGVRKK